MRPATFFRIALLAPVLLPLAGRVAGASSEFALTLYMSAVVGGAPYLIVATFLWVRVGKLQSVEECVRLALWAPLLFVPVLWVAWLTWSLANPSVPRTFGNLMTPLVPLGVYGLLFGYAYVLFSSVLYLLLHRLGVVTEVETETESKDIGGATGPL